MPSRNDGLSNLMTMSDLLIIEDDKNITRVIKTALEIEGYSVKSYQSGEDAEEFLFSNEGRSIQLIIQDSQS